MTLPVLQNSVCSDESGQTVFLQRCVFLWGKYSYFLSIFPQKSPHPWASKRLFSFHWSGKNYMFLLRIVPAFPPCQDKARRVTPSPCATVKGECWSLAAVADWSMYTQLDTQHCSAQGSQTVTTCTVTKRETPNQFLQLIYYQIYLPGNYSNWISFNDLKSLALPTPPGSGWQSAFKNIQHLHLKNFTVMLHPSSSVSDS